MRGGPQPRSTTTFYFRPDGRFYNREVQVTVSGVSGGRGNVSTRTSGRWGRYRIIPADEEDGRGRGEAGGVGRPRGETIVLETDDGEPPIRAELRDGRRTLKWGRTPFSHIGAGLEEVERPDERR